MTAPPTPVAQQLMQRLADLEARLAAQERSQQQVFTDPTGATGDPAHGHAVVVIGNLAPITGINAFGLAAWSGSGWTHLT
jgi:hypothetical protein